MKILCNEHLEKTKRYAESIGDKSLQECLKRWKIHSVLTPCAKRR